MFSFLLILSSWQLLIYPLFLSMNLPLLEISYKWNHIHMAWCKWHLSVSTMFSRFIHVQPTSEFPCSSRLNNLSLYGQTIFIIIHLSATGCLDRFYLLLATVNSTAISTRVEVLFEHLLSILLGMLSRSETSEPYADFQI